MFTKEVSYSVILYRLYIYGANCRSQCKSPKKYFLLVNQFIHNYFVSYVSVSTNVLSDLFKSADHFGF